MQAVVYVSRWMKSVTERYLHLSHPNSFIVPNPVDTDLFRVIIPIKDRPRNAIAVRSMGYKYGLDIAIIAFSKFPYKLTIIGKGPLEHYLRSLAKKYNSNVEFNTEGVEHEKLPFIYNQYSLFVAPSRTEAQGVAMCEAMASGLPVVATRVGGIPEFVLNGYNGFLVEPENPLELRKAI
ncbi:MAG: glycosyltransferase family 4 protein, partial [Fervidicoccus fontis]